MKAADFNREKERKTLVSAFVCVCGSVSRVYFKIEGKEETLPSVPSVLIAP